MGYESFLVSVLFMIAAAAIAYFLFDRMEDAVEDIRAQQQVAAGLTLGDLYVGMKPETFFAVRVLVTSVFFLFGYLSVNVFLGIFLAAGAYVAPGLVLTRLRVKRVLQIETQLVEALELMGNALKSGLTLPQAIELVVKEFRPPLSQEFSRVLAENRLGVDVAAGLNNMAERLNSTVVSILATGVAIVKRCGGDMTQIFQNIAGVIREQAHMEGKLKAVTAQGRFQGLILSIMPFGLMIALWFIDRSHIEALFGYQIGLIAVASVVVMVICANVWISKLLDIDM